jgi:hypothetical protein
MERKCGKIHSSIEEAIVHAEQNLGFYRKPADRYFGTLKNNSHLVVGFQVSPRKRWRLDFDPMNGKWVHIGEFRCTDRSAKDRTSSRNSSVRPAGAGILQEVDQPILIAMRPSEDVRQRTDFCR